MTPSYQEVLEVLRSVTDPVTSRDIVREGAIRDLKVEGNTLSLTLLQRRPSRTFESVVPEACRRAVAERWGGNVTLEVKLESELMGLEVQGQSNAASSGILNYIAVASGKGGVGKSTVAVNLALALAAEGYDVGLVDTDIYGPSIPLMFGITEERPRVNERRKIEPLKRYGISLLSMGFLVDPTQATIWRGPMVSSAIRQFLNDTEWGELDYLIMDLPPGTGDIQLTIVQTVPLTGAIIVSTPQEVALADARKGVGMFRNVQVPVIGVVENMAYFTPPDMPDRKYYLFGRGGARRLAEDLKTPFLGEIPLQQEIREGGDEGKPIVISEPSGAVAAAFRHMARNTVRQTELRNALLPAGKPIEILHR